MRIKLPSAQRCTCEAYPFCEHAPNAIAKQPRNYQSHSYTKQAAEFARQHGSVATAAPKYVPPTTLHAVFEVRNSKRNSYPGKEPETVCHIEYVGLCGQLTPGAVLPLLTKQVAAKHSTSDVTFRFWCDTSCATGGSPTYYRLEGSKVVERE